MLGKWSKWSQNCENLCRSGAKNLCNGEEIGIDSTHLKRYNDSQVHSFPFFFSFFFFGGWGGASAVFDCKEISDVRFCFRKKAAAILDRKQQQ
jgi:hypothetical protein